MMEFISSSAPPSEPPEPDEMPPWVAELSEEERAIVWPYDSSDVAVSDGEQLRLMSGEEVEAQPSLAQPSLYKLAEPDERLMDHEEAFMFDTFGYLLLRGVMDAEWLSAAREAIAAHETDGVTGDGYTDPTQSEALRGVPGVAQRVYNGGSTVALPEPHCFPFRKMMTHPGIMSRLQVSTSAGFTAFAPAASEGCNVAVDAGSRVPLLQQRRHAGVSGVFPRPCSPARPPPPAAPWCLRAGGQPRPVHALRQYQPDGRGPCVGNSFFLCRPQSR